MYKGTHTAAITVAKNPFDSIQFQSASGRNPIRFRQRTYGRTDDFTSARVLVCAALEADREDGNDGNGHGRSSSRRRRLDGGLYSKLYVVLLLELGVVDSVMIHHDDMLKIVAGISVLCRIQSGFMM